jgi:hypothetical protein
MDQPPGRAFFFTRCVRTGVATGTRTDVPDAPRTEGIAGISVDVGGRTEALPAEAPPRLGAAPMTGKAGMRLAVVGKYVVGCTRVT